MLHCMFSFCGVVSLLLYYISHLVQRTRQDSTGPLYVEGHNVMTYDKAVKTPWWVGSHKNPRKYFTNTKLFFQDIYIYICVKVINSHKGCYL